MWCQKLHRELLSPQNTYFCNMSGSPENMRDSFYEKLALKLEEEHKFPAIYMFKFIVPNEKERISDVEKLFGEEAKITYKKSNSNKYISVTAKEIMISADRVIEVYKKAEEIEGIISL